MPIRYYPPSKIIPNLSTVGDEFVDSTGKPYVGKYYKTFEGKYFSGAYPELNKNEPLKRAQIVDEDTADERGPVSIDYDLVLGKSIVPASYKRTKGVPASYQPQPTQSDYMKGYVTRYFTKKENENGFVTEISQEEYTRIVNGQVLDYDISIYQTTKILWKLTGPLNSQRKSQYNVIPGIIDTNKRLTEASEKNFVGIIDFIGGQYDKFARPTP